MRITIQIMKKEIESERQTDRKRETETNTRLLASKCGGTAEGPVMFGDTERQRESGKKGRSTERERGRQIERKK